MIPFVSKNNHATDSTSSSVDLRFIPSMKIIHAVVYVDVSHIDSDLSSMAQCKTVGSDMTCSILTCT